MSDLVNIEKCFTFTWTLENVSYYPQKKGIPIKSPAFVVGEIPKTKWSLWLYPRGSTKGNYIACYLNREGDCPGEETVIVKSELALIDEAGLNLRSLHLGQQSFLKGRSWGTEFEKREKVFISERSKFLPKDTLRIRCRIWKEAGVVENVVWSFARTRIGVEKRSFLWRLGDFSSLETEEEHTYLIKSLDTDEKLMSVDLYLTGELNYEEMIRFKLTCRDENIKYCTFRLCLVDIQGTKVECNRDEFFIEKPDNAHRLCVVDIRGKRVECNSGEFCTAKCGHVHRFNLSFSRQKLIQRKSRYLPNDVLSLHWECVFSKGIISEEIEQVHYGYTAP